MELIWFETSIVAPDMHGNVVFAFIDGAIDDRLRKDRRVTMLICKVAATVALRAAIDRALADLAEKD